MAEAFVGTLKRDYVRVSLRPDAEAVMRKLSSWFTDENEVHPPKDPGYRSPREFIAPRGTLRSFRGYKVGNGSTRLPDEKVD